MVLIVMGSSGSHADAFERRIKKPTRDMDRTIIRMTLEEQRTRQKLTRATQLDPKSPNVNALVALLARQMFTRRAIERQRATIGNVSGMVHMATAVSVANEAAREGVLAVEGALPRAARIQRTRIDLESTVLNLDATTELVDDMASVIYTNSDEETRSEVEELAKCIRDEYHLAVVSQANQVPPLVHTNRDVDTRATGDVEAKHE